MFSHSGPRNTRTVVRDVKATVIPSGDEVTLPMGTQVTITHRLGGNFTVTCDFGMFRIRGADHEAIDEPAPEAVEANREGSAAEPHDGPPDEEKLWDALKSVFDPEIPVNIVDLGLVYSLNVNKADDSDSYAVAVDMTLTAPGCGMGPSIAADAESRLCSVPGVSSAKVELVWDPPWSQEMISEEGKMQLGMI